MWSETLVLQDMLEDQMKTCRKCGRKCTFLRIGERCEKCWYDSLSKPYACRCGQRFPSKRALAGHIGGLTIVAGQRIPHGEVE